MQAERVLGFFFSFADQVYCQDAGNRRQTPEPSPLAPPPPLPGFLPLPARVNAMLKTTKANICDLLELTVSDGWGKGGGHGRTLCIHPQSECIYTRASVSRRGEDEETTPQLEWSGSSSSSSTPLVYCAVSSSSLRLTAGDYRWGEGLHQALRHV